MPPRSEKRHRAESPADRVTALPSGVQPPPEQWEKVTAAVLLAARGEDRAAAAMLDQWVPQNNGGLAVYGLLIRAGIAERLGDLATARRAYRHVADSWRHADPELAGYEAEAEAGIARLSSRTR